ncbi:MAG TPA: tetratricopeptide repeat protein [Streptomyces sp.]|nr:tetratricopeptide repeat protein [Streptomyces sp.]
MRSSRTVRRFLLVVAAAIVLTVTAWAAGLPVPGTGQDPARDQTVTGRDGVRRAGDVAGALPGDGLGDHIDALRRHLRDQPRDAANWAALGTGLVEQARRSAEPDLYTQAQRAFTRSLRLRPARSNSAALAGRAALAAARHDFRSALRLSDQALALSPYGELALLVRVDALVELGRYPAAHRAALLADARRPGIPAFTRLAYVQELRGERAAARRTLGLALRSASAPGDTAQVATALGELSRAQGRSGRALREYAVALRADRDHLPALLGRGQVRAATGDLPGAVRDLRAVVARLPLPAHLALLGEVYEAQGDRRAAAREYAALDAWTRIARANQVNTDLDTALVAADHGDPAQALRTARAEWDRRRTVHTADALAWALHREGRDEEALSLIRRATAGRLNGGGYRNAQFLYHRAEIAQALGRATEARAHRKAALELKTALSPRARTVLDRWTGAAR